MAPAQLDVAPISITQEHKPIMTKENKPPIPVGAGAKKAMDSYFTGINSTSLEFRQRSSSSSRTVLKSSSRGTTPSRDLPSTSNRDNCVDAEMLANALKKMPGLERNVHRPTPPRSRSISRAESPLPDAEMLDESLPDFYKVTLKKTDRTGSQTRDIVLDGHRQTSQAQRTPSVEPQMQRFRRGSFSGTSLKDGEEANLPEFKRVVLKRTPSREQLDDEATHRASTRKSNIVKEKSISRCGSYSSLTSINKTVLSRRSSVSEDRPEFLDVRLKKAGSRAASPDGDDSEAKSSSMSRSGSYTSLANINRANWSRRASLSSSDEPAFKGVALKKTGSKQDLSQNDLRSRASATPEPEFANVSLKKSKRVQGEQSKFELESVSLKPIPVGEVTEEEKNEFTSMERVSRCRVERTTKFESGDDEYENIQSSLNRLKGVQIEESEEEREKRKEQERKEREERDKERKEREEKAKLEREAREKADKEARERREKRAREQKERAVKEQKEKEEMEKKLKAEMEQKREELERIRKEKEERAKAEKEQREREMKEQEEKHKKDREERLRKEKEEREQKQQEERERKEQLKKEADIAEKERKIKEQKEKEKQERKEKIRLEIEGKVKHKVEEKERKEKEREDRVEEKLKLNEDAEEKTVYYRRRRSSEEKESSKTRRNNLIKRMSFTSCENINLSSHPDTEKVHLSVFSREMGSNHDLVQICQDQGQGKHEVKLQFMLGQQEEEDQEEEQKEEQKQEQKEEESEEEEETSEEVVVIQRLERTESRMTKAFEDTEELIECSGNQSTGSKRLNPLQKAPSVDGLFQTQEVNAAFTFKLPTEQQQQQQPKLSFQLPTIA